MKGMTLEAVAKACDGIYHGSDGDKIKEVSAITTDSRQIQPQGMFIAIKGARSDGHAYIDSCYEKGALCCISEQELPGEKRPYIQVESSLQALKDIAQLYRANLDIKVVGITGSVGKTSTKETIAAVLSQKYKVLKTQGNFNNEIGLPLTSLKVHAETRFLVAEMGANHVGEIANLTSLVPPDIAVVLKVGVAHLGEFGSPERIAQAKSEIIHGLVPGGLSVLNANDEHVAAMSAFAPGDVMWFGLPNGDGGNPAITAQHVRCDELDHPSFTLENGDGEHAEVTLGICGQHNVMNALAAASVAMHLGMSIGEVASALSDVTAISPHRMAVSTVNKQETSFTLIDDSFNANPDSMKAGLDGLLRWKAGSESQPFRIAVLGAMLELGPDEKDLHVGIGRYALEGGVDALLTVGSASDASLDALAGAMADGASLAGDASHVYWVHDIDEADRLVTQLAVEHPGAVVLLKGSHASGLSALAERWQDLAAQ